MSEIKNSRLGLYGAKHSKCNCMMTLDLRGYGDIAKTDFFNFLFLFLFSFGLNALKFTDFNVTFRKKFPGQSPQTQFW